MLEWIGVVVVSVLLLFGVYAFTFSISMMLTKKNLSVRKFMGEEMWRTSLLTSPIITVLAVLLILLLSGGNLNDWGFLLLGIEYVAPTILIGLFSSTIVVVLLRFGPATKQMIKDRSTRNLLIFTTLIVIFASLSEEILFRGFLQTWIDRTLLLSISVYGIPVTSGAVIGAIIFGLLHALPAALQDLSVPAMMTSSFILGITAGVFLTITSSLLAPIIIHVLYNICGLVNDLTLSKEAGEVEGTPQSD